MKQMSRGYINYIIENNNMYIICTIGSILRSLLALGETSYRSNRRCTCILSAFWSSLAQRRWGGCTGAYLYIDTYQYIDTQILFYFFYLREYRATKVNQIKLLPFVIKTKTRRRSIILGIRRVYNIFYNNAIISLKRVSGQLGRINSRVLAAGPRQVFNHNSIV